MTPATAGTPTNACRFTGKRKIGNSGKNIDRDNKSGVQAFMVQRFVDKSMVIKANLQERKIKLTARRKICYFPDTVPLKTSQQDVSTVGTEPPASSVLRISRNFFAIAESKWRRRGRLTKEQLRALNSPPPPHRQGRGGLPWTN
jgi:hypothetical protein